MTPGDILGKVREHYLKHFRDILRERRREPQSHLVVEPIVKMGGVTPLREGALGLPRRLDLVVQNEEGAAQVAIQTRHGILMEPIDFAWTRATMVHIHPFRWEECPIRVPGYIADEQWGPLLNWFDKWFDEFENRVSLSKDVHEVIHGLSDPMFGDDDTTTVVIDLGSATLEGFEEMLDAFAEMETTSIHIGLPVPVA